MVNAMQPLDEAIAAERVLALSYAPADVRAAVTALFGLDARLREIARRARDPMIGTMRLVWWRDALAALDEAPAPAEPLLRTLAAEVLPRGACGAALAVMAEAWAGGLEGEVDWAAVARERGGRLFGLAAMLLGEEDDRVGRLGEAWAGVDLARDWPVAAAVPDELFARRWPRRLRALGALGLLARSDLDATNRPGSPSRVARLLAHRLTGR